MCAFPFNIRRLVGGWKFLYLDGKPFTPDPDAVGAVESRRLSGQRSGPLRRMPQPAQRARRHRRGQRFAGGPSPDGEGWVPNITQAGIGDYSVGDIEEILTSGQTPDGDSVGGAMAAVVRNTAQLSKEDRAAMAAYVKSLPPVEGPKPPEAK